MPRGNEFEHAPLRRLTDDYRMVELDDVVNERGRPTKGGSDLDFADSADNHDGLEFGLGTAINF